VALRGVTPLSYTDAYNNGLYAYFVGGFRTEQEAKEGADMLRKMGFKAPVVAVWVDGEYYPTVEDMRRSESQYNVEISGVPTLTDELKARVLAHQSDCTISRIGSTFVIGTFEGKSAAEAVAADLRAAKPEIVVKITKKP
jgi:sulfur carrier protein ThiS